MQLNQNPQILSQDRPLVSILMPAYNAEKYIAKAINSIQNQTYSNWELLICDDKSSDSTIQVVEMVAQSPKIKISKNKVNIGYLKTINNLFKQTKGEYITFLDSDDTSTADRIEIQTLYLLENPNVGAVGCWTLEINDEKSIKRIGIRPIYHDEILKTLPIKSAFCGATLMVRRSTLQAIGGYRIFYDRVGNEDYDWSWRIAEKFRTHNIPKPLYIRRIHPNSISQTPNPKKLVTVKLVQHLAELRARTSKVLADDEELKIAEDYIENQLAPYKVNPALVYLEFAAKSMYSNLFLNAIKLSAKAIIMKPTSITSWRTLLYCIRQTFSKTMVKHIRK